MKDYGKSLDRFYVALGTPLKDDRFTVDYDAFRKLVKHFSDCPEFAEVGGVIVLPEAGEVFSLEREEKQELIRITVEEAKGKLPVFAGVYSYNVPQTVLQAKDAQELGVDGLFIMPAGGAMDITLTLNKAKNPWSYIELAKAVAKEVDLPFLAHAAGPADAWSIGFPPEAVVKMMEEVPNFVGWKMLYTSTPAYLAVAKALREYEARSGHHVGLLAAGANMYYDAMLHGIMDGSISCHWNYARDLNLKLIHAWKANDWAAMKHIWIEEGMFELHQATTQGIDPNSNRLHSNFKVMTWLAGLIPNPYVRQPMVQPFKAEVEALRDVRRKYNMPTISDEEINKVLETLPR